MEENRRNLFYLETVGNASALERSLAKVSGVLSVKVNVENKTLEYVIDEWASDYDVFTEVMRICSECGAVIDFDRKEEEPQVEEVAPDNGEYQETGEEVIIEEEEEYEEPATKPEKDKKSLISERAQRLIEIGVAIATYVVALFLTDIAQYIFLAISFAMAGYDALYEAIVKITKKQFVSEELLITVAFFASIVLGYASYAVIALLLYSIVAFARKTIKEEIDKNPAFSQNPPKVTVYNENGAVNIDADSVKSGDTVLLYANTVSAYDGIIQNECLIEDFKGDVREAVSGDEIYAGEKVLADVQVVVSAIGEDCKFGKYNAFVREATKQSAPLAEKMKKHSQLINICVFAFCLLITFIPPIFSENYVENLSRWAYTGVIIATVSGLGFYVFASEINLLSLLTRGRKCKLGFAGYNSVLRLANANKVFLDYENALCDENGEMKDDSVGAVRELKDAKIKDIALVCSLSDDRAEEVCKRLKIKEYYSRESQEEKNEQLKIALSEGGAVATSAENFITVSEQKGAIVCFECEKQGYVGDASVSSGEIAYLPYALKLARRTAGIQKANLIMGFAVKAVIAILAILGLAHLWWAVLADSIVSVICAFIAFINSKEMY